MSLKIMYVDESKTKKKEYMAVTGLIVEAEKILALSFDLEKVCKKYLGEKFSLLEKTHCLKWIRKTSTEKKGNPFAKISHKKRYELSEEIYLLLDKFKCKIVSCLVGNSPSSNHQDQINSGIYFVIERFFYDLDSDGGMIIADNGHHIKFKKKLIENLNGSSYKDEKFNTKIYSNIYFTHDEEDLLIQLTDLISFNLTSYVSNVLEIDGMSLRDLAEEFDFDLETKQTYYFKLIRPYFRTRYNKITGGGIKVWY